MKKKTGRKTAMLMVMAMLTVTLAGCGNLLAKDETDSPVPEEQLSDNVILTETGETIEKEATPSPTQEEEQSATQEPLSDAPKPLIELTEPEQEQVISEEDQVEPTDSELQLVFLGDSIFDNHRDGTGVPYLTSVACEADVYNLAIGGTSATIEWEESQEYGKWTSRSLCGIINALKGVIPTDIFAGTRAKDILDNPKIDFSQTDYFIVEYGLNDYFRAVPLDIEGTTYDVRCYTGALRYAVSNLRSIAPDATIILCCPTYAQFYNDGYLIGDGNVTNTGYGTLFDYTGICNYVSREQQTLFFNAYQDLGFDGYTAEEYLEDGVHLTEEGRQIYADALSKLILDNEETKNN